WPFQLGYFSSAPNAPPVATTSARSAQAPKSVRTGIGLLPARLKDMSIKHYTAPGAGGMPQVPGGGRRRHGPRPGASRAAQHGIGQEVRAEADFGLGKWCGRL